MKKLLTLLFALGTITTLFAQQGRNYPSKDNRNDSRDVILGQGNDRHIYDNGRYGNYSFSERERDAKVRKIDREFDARIRQVQKSRYLRSWEKRQEIRSLEMQKVQAIRKVNERFQDRRNVYNDNRSYRNNRRY